MEGKDGQDLGGPAGLWGRGTGGTSARASGVGRGNSIAPWVGMSDWAFPSLGLHYEHVQAFTRLG